MTEILKFKVFCIERYKVAHHMSGKDTLDLFIQFGVLDYLGAFYDVLHTVGDRYIVSDIDEFIAVRQQVQ